VSLRVDGLSVAFDGVSVLDRVDLEVAECSWGHRVAARAPFYVP
jgi:ABC-type branched-subunit amino acid transport system ATPase component